MALVTDVSPNEKLDMLSFGHVCRRAKRVSSLPLGLTNFCVKTTFECRYFVSCLFLTRRYSQGRYLSTISGLITPTRRHSMTSERRKTDEASFIPLFLLTAFDGRARARIIPSFSAIFKDIFALAFASSCSRLQRQALTRALLLEPVHRLRCTP
ncbi:hypothetical protein BC835DRAFT_11973 [Cytidiella melzeri]|nr:hypothetical protein BC835DRAFT_11973 [Cytidiella melzeri]